MMLNQVNQSVLASVSVVITATRHPVLASGFGKHIMTLSCLSMQKNKGEKTSGQIILFFQLNDQLFEACHITKRVALPVSPSNVL